MIEPPQYSGFDVSGVPPWVIFEQRSTKRFSSHPPASRNFGKRSLGFNSISLFFFIAFAALLLIRTEAGDVAPVGPFVEQGE